MNNISLKRNNNTNYRLDINGLRAFAVIAVIVNHFNKQILPSGYLGVDIFFVISGFVITSSIFNRNLKGNLKDFIFNFYKRRLIRLKPSLIFFVLIAGLIITFFNPNAGENLKTGITSLFGFSNIYLFSKSTDYFAQSSDLNIFMHTWSLGVEEQFYLVFPFLTFFTGFSQNKSNGFKRISILLTILFFASILSFIHSYRYETHAAYFLMHNRFWELAFGSLIFLYQSKDSYNKEFFKKIPAEIILLIIVVIMFSPNIYGMQNTISSVFLTGLLILCLKKGTILFNILTTNCFYQIGRISYSLYLWHWLVLCISRWTIGITWWTIPIQIILIFYISLYSNKYIENKSFKFFNKEKSFKTFSFLLLSFISTFCVLIGLGKPFKGVFYLGDKSRINNFSERKYWNFMKCNLSSDTLAYKSFNYSNCWVSSNGTLNSLPKENKRLFMYGNSYNAQLMPLAGLYFQNNQPINIHSYYHVGCLPSESIEFSKNNKFGICRIKYQKYLKYFRENSRTGDAIILVNSLGYFLENSDKPLYYKGKKISKIDAFNIYKSEIKEFSNKLNEKGINLLLVSPIPLINSDPNICSLWISKYNPKCKESFYDYQMNEEIDVLSYKLKKIENDQLIYLDINSELKEIFLKSNHNLYSFYSDKEHLSKDGALLLFEYFSRNLSLVFNED